MVCNRYSGTKDNNRVKDYQTESEKSGTFKGMCIISVGNAKGRICGDNAEDIHEGHQSVRKEKCGLPPPRCGVFRSQDGLRARVFPHRSLA
jgi:hypothetical protein